MKNFSRLCALAVGAFTIIGATAQSLPLPDNQAPNRLLLDVDGVVCSYCSYGIKKKLSKLAFIDKSQYNDGIYVDIDQQQVLVAIQPGQVADVEAAFKAVRDGGYDPLRACVTDNAGELECVDASAES
ncbi:heavy metal-associated domain-containing protein [Porticoccus sp. W117]|uniref:heavy-metal-associated domain-containing protein n=1 Tax=Porticoccus sp. W117 TaxID=3054777 RepID=UPI00259831B5|nr:heavy metal-associated domain-containing protein [Porticoccus sp. W117]MDM3870800.1 heavy metal-associated domain-containing protein [Porticoccus sp. W117]